MKNNQRLGKGLEALLGGDVNELISDIENSYSKDEVINIKLKDVSPNPFQPRQVFNEEKIDELVASIIEHGVFTPIIIKKAAEGYNIVAGERRYRASKKAGNETIPAIVVDFDDRLMMEIALLENIQRENLNPIEEATALKNIMDAYSYTQELLAKKMGKSRSHVANTLRLLSLNQKVQELILNDIISMGHAKVLIGLDDVTLDIVINEVCSKSLSVRETEKLVNELKSNTKKEQRVEQPKKEYKAIENVLQEKFNSKVRVSNSSVTISFADESDLNNILDIIGVEID